MVTAEQQHVMRNLVDGGFDNRDGSLEYGYSESSDSQETWV